MIGSSHSYCDQFLILTLDPGDIVFVSVAQRFKSLAMLKQPWSQSDLDFFYRTNTYHFRLMINRLVTYFEKSHLRIDWPSCSALVRSSFFILNSLCKIAPMLVDLRVQKFIFKTCQRSGIWQWVLFV